MTALLASLGLRLFGPRVFAKLPWRLIAIGLGVAGLLLAYGWHGRQITTITRAADKAGFTRATTAFVAAQARADAAATQRQHHIADAGNKLNQEAVYDFTAANSGVATRAGAYRLRRIAEAEHSRQPGAVPGSVGTAARIDGAACGAGFLQPNLSEQAAESAASFETEIRLRADAERIGVQLDALQAWEAARLAIETANPKDPQ